MMSGLGGYITGLVFASPMKNILDYSLKITIILTFFIYVICLIVNVFIITNEPSDLPMMIIIPAIYVLSSLLQEWIYRNSDTIINKLKNKKT